MGMATSSRNYAVAVVILSLEYLRKNYCDLWSDQTQHICASDEFSDLLIALMGCHMLTPSYLGCRAKFRPAPLNVSVD